MCGQLILPTQDLASDLLKQTHHFFVFRYSLGIKDADKAGIHGGGCRPAPGPMDALFYRLSAAQGYEYVHPLATYRTSLRLAT